jgi:ribosome-binding factor A
VTEDRPEEKANLMSLGGVPEEMTLNKRTRRRLRNHCGELREDDAIDPRDYFKPSRRGGDNRKTLQLCSQVGQTLALVLSGEIEDELLQDLQVEAVVPAPNASQLAVMLRAEPLDDARAAEIRIRLLRVAGLLRSEVAAAITRRKAPKLIFHLLGPAAH